MNTYFKIDVKITLFTNCVNGVDTDTILFELIECNNFTYTDEHCLSYSNFMVKV